VKRANGELPADLRKFVEGARNGVIVVSFGSMIPSFPKVFVEKFFDAFRRLDADGYRVIWRLKNNDGVPVPENVLTMSWLPQNDLLGHPATKLFITHCGNNGQYEAIYNGVPMIGFPLLGDQEHNGKRLEYKGYGVTMNIFQFTADEPKTSGAHPRYSVLHWKIRRRKRRIGSITWYDSAVIICGQEVRTCRCTHI
jgi:UDP:flavonoid glycosyltransferase YjiC (YdhE family)